MQFLRKREIAVLPEGSITKKKIRGKDYYYHRISRDGKRIENYVSFEQVPDLKDKIEKRKTLEKKLRELCKRQVLFLKKWHLFFPKCGKLFS